MSEAKMKGVRPKGRTPFFVCGQGMERRAK